jgi:glucose/arabinose dehydrogenase
MGRYNMVNRTNTHKPFGAARVTTIAALVGTLIAGAGWTQSSAHISTQISTSPSAQADGGTGRPPVPGANGKVPTTGTTLPLATTKLLLTKIGSMDQPIAVSTRPGDEALFIADKAGSVRVIRNSTTSQSAVDGTPVLDISKKVSSENERGLLGVAFKPDDPSRMFVDYTDLKGNVTISEFPYDGEKADASKERVLLSIPKPFNEHNAGTIFFDAAGMLMIGIGDGGGSGDQYNNAQRVDVLLGKVLRINVNPNTGSGTAKPYSIPADNPFVPKTGAAALKSKVPANARQEIWAYGLRNPWRISIDRGTGDVWVPDVGQNLYEEINRMPSGTSGTNFGWRLREGKQSYKGAKPIGAVDPVYDYPHKDGRCAIAGGFVYRGTKLPGIIGWYVFGDVCTGQVAALRPDGAKWTPLSLGVKVSYLTAFGEDRNGELYATSLEGAIYRLDPA